MTAFDLSIMYGIKLDISYYFHFFLFSLYICRFRPFQMMIMLFEYDFCVNFNKGEG